MGRRARRRGAAAPEAPLVRYARPGHAFGLRTVLTLPTRAQYAAIGGAREDAWQRRVEFLFERLVAEWSVEGVEVPAGQLLARFRLASADERALVRDVLREHLAEHFPDVATP